jgi:hypothetical protein
MKVLLARPADLRSRLDILRAARLLGDAVGWWRVLLFGRTGPIANPIRFDWHQVDVALVPGMLPALINAMVMNLRRDGWTIKHWMEPGMFCVRARRRRCLACDIEPELRAKLRRSPCSKCRGRGWLGPAGVVSVVRAQALVLDGLGVEMRTINDAVPELQEQA